MSKKFSDVASAWWPVWLLFLVVIAISAYLLIFQPKMVLGPDPYEQFSDCIKNPNCSIEGLKEDTRSDKEKCLSNAMNMMQAWRCKRI